MKQFYFYIQYCYDTKKIFSCMSQRICSIQTNFLFFYNLVEWKQYFLWFNKILFDSSKYFGSLDKMVWLNQTYLFLLVHLNFFGPEKKKIFNNVFKQFYFKVQYCYDTNTIFNWTSQIVYSTQPNLLFLPSIWLSWF